MTEHGVEHRKKPRKTINKEELRSLYLQDYTSKEIANKLGANKDYIKRLIRELPEYVQLTQQERLNKQHAKTISKREQAFIESLINSGYDYEYVDGYKNNISPVNLRCKKCGEIVTFNASFVRKGLPALCPCCIQKKKEMDHLRNRLIKAIKGLYMQEKKKSRQKVQDEKIKIRECLECGTEFITNNKKTLCCTPECTNRRQNRLKEINRRHKLKENGKVDYSISLHRLIKKHNGKCGICGRKVDIKADPNSDTYPSIDHVFPVSKGGTHTWDNVQLAHRGCNTLKRDSVMIEETNGQLRLCL